jgi:dTDP-4-dehydrorhamnose 3,5-epimerase
MIFTPLPLADAALIQLEKKEDARGYFVRTFCSQELLLSGTPFSVVQSNLSYNTKKATLRGLHYQLSPYEEDKIVYCLKGTIFDVILDIRPDSPTYGQWFSVELSEAEKNGLFIPKGFAHGFQTLCDECEVLYLMSAPYVPEAARGVLWNDPALSIPWPLQEPIISDRDQQFPCLYS